MPPLAARGRATNRHTIRAYDSHDAPYSRARFGNGSPPRHVNEVASRFEQPFERPARVYVAEGRGRFATGATFRNGRIGDWENWQVLVSKFNGDRKNCVVQVLQLRLLSVLKDEFSPQEETRPGSPMNKNRDFSVRNPRNQETREPTQTPLRTQRTGLTATM